MREAAFSKIAPNHPRNQPTYIHSLVREVTNTTRTFSLTAQGSWFANLSKAFSAYLY
jgi:hypothetical protein